jgi:hypothetical protein
MTDVARTADLAKIEAYMARTRCTAAALSKAAVGYPGIVSQIRGIAPVSQAKRNRVLAYMEANPNGPPKVHKPRQMDRTMSRYAPDELKSSTGPSTPVPVPAISGLSSAEWIRKTAFKRRLALAIFLAELVELGIIQYQKEHSDDA